MTLPYWLGGFFQEVIKQGGIWAGVIVLVIILFIFGFGWAIRHWLTDNAKIRNARIEMERDANLEDAKLSREQKESDWQHIRKMEQEGEEWRKFMGNHMEHYLVEIKELTAGIKVLSDSHSRFAAKNIESMNLICEKLRNHDDKTDDVHRGIEAKLDNVTGKLSTVEGYIQGSRG